MDIKLDINEALDSLAKAFNVTVDYLYPVLVTQAKISAYVTMAWFSATVILFLICLIMFIFHTKKVLSDKYHSEFNEGASIVSAIVGVVSFLVILFAGTDAIETILTALYNPDYFMVKQVMEVISNKSS